MKARLGFTLIELLMVVVVIGILLGLFAPSLSGIRRNARETKALAEAGAIENAMKAFFQEYGEWPAGGATIWSNDNMTVIRELRRNGGKNSRQIKFLEEENFTVEGNILVDPEGNPYVIKIDPDYPGGALITDGVDVGSPLTE